MTPISAEIVRALLTKQFNASFFHIGLIDECLKVSNTFADPATYTKLNALHAVSYTDMTPVLRRWLFETCVNLFTGNGFNMNILDASQPFPPAPGVQINIGGEWVKKFIEK